MNLKNSLHFCIFLCISSILGVLHANDNPTKTVEGNSLSKTNAYVDQVIDASTIKESKEFDYLGKDESDDGNYRFYSLETGFNYEKNTSQDLKNETKEAGFSFNYYTQTKSYGDFRIGVEGSVVRESTYENNNKERTYKGGYFYLASENYTLGNGWLLNSYIGNQSFRGVDNSFGYKHSLNNPQIKGASLKVHKAGTKDFVSIFAGKKTRSSSGIRFSHSKDTTEDKIYRIGFYKQLSSKFGVSGQYLYSDYDEGYSLAAMKDEKVQSLTSTISYNNDDKDGISLQAITDFKNGTGFYLDIEHNRQHKYNYGIYYLPQDLRWDGTSIGGKEGAYFNTAFKFAESTANLRLNYDNYNTKDKKNPQSGHKTYSLYTSINKRLSNRQNVYASYSVRKDDYNNDDLDKSSHSLNTSYFYNKNNNSHGITYSYNKTISQESNYSNELNYNYGISNTATGDWDFNLGVFVQKNKNNTVTRPEVGIGWSKQVTDNLSLSANASYQKTYSKFDERKNNTSDGLSGSISADLSLSKNWQTGISANFNKAQYDTEKTYQTDYNSTNVYAYLRYSNSAGRTNRSESMRNGYGEGEISGRIFFDENGDGVKQTNEPVARGIKVTINDFNSEITDNNGRYSFSGVSPGEHYLIIDISSVPLPWGLVDERPKKIKISTRSLNKQKDLGLIKIN